MLATVGGGGDVAAARVVVLPFANHRLLRQPLPEIPEFMCDNNNGKRGDTKLLHRLEKPVRGAPRLSHREMALGGLD